MTAPGWVKAQEGIVGGRSYTIATTCRGCAAGCGVLAKCRDGRPIKLEGNPEHPISGGGLCAIGHASVLSLYDALRFDGPRRRGKPASWGDADHEIRVALDAVRTSRGKVRLLTGTLTSPSAAHAIEAFTAAAGDGRHVSYDALGGSAILDAHLATHGRRVMPRYRFENADVVAAFDADFLGTWISPVAFARGWASRRDPEAGKMSRHWQFEARVSVTGGCADERFRLGPFEMADALTGLRAAVTGAAIPDSTPQRGAIARLAAELLDARARSLVVCGSNDPVHQVLVNEINEALDNYGQSLDLEHHSRQRLGDDRALLDLLSELDAGEVDVLVVSGCNPVYDLPAGTGGTLRRARMIISTAALRDETSDVADWICPEPHYLECWDDAEPVLGTLSLTQPTVPPLRSARTLRESLARWSGDQRSDRELVAAYWREHVHPKAPGSAPFTRFFNRALHDGFATIERPQAPALPKRPVAPRESTDGESKPLAPGTFALVLYPKVALLDGSHAQNPWLQELPDPVSRLAWESYATLAPDAAKAAGLVEGDVVRLEVPGDTRIIELPIHVEPGQHARVIGVALGYGRAGTDRFAGIGPPWLEARRTVEPGETVGLNAARWLRFSSGGLRFDRTDVRIAKTSAHVELASVQEHRSLDVPAHLASPDHATRDVAKSATLREFQRMGADAFAGAHAAGRAGLWPNDHATSAPKWGLAIDLGACTGCSACVVSCQAENNIPVVGRDEVRRHREMSWIRIDRYVSGDSDAIDVSRQPMMCQHCGNAPCESVCPVLATVHSREGLNEQIYNRCVGTRYCANTCPYKVRRFNWFDYARDDALENHALNPDVTVRSRGVMEKCSLCLQRIEEARLEAKRRGEPVRDGDIRTACQQSCPTQAIVFGDLSDHESKVSKLLRGGRGYRALEELNVAPRVTYLARIRNTEEGA